MSENEKRDGGGREGGDSAEKMRKFFSEELGRRMPELKSAVADHVASKLADTVRLEVFAAISKFAEMSREADAAKTGAAESVADLRKAVDAPKSVAIVSARTIRMVELVLGNSASA